MKKQNKPVVQSGAEADPNFAVLIDAFATDEQVTHGGKGFGSNGLKVLGKLFAMPVHGQLVLKLPRAHVQQLVESGEGVLFDPGHGRPMKEWIVLESSRRDRVELAQLACRYVRDGKI